MLDKCCTNMLIVNLDCFLYAWGYFSKMQEMETKSSLTTVVFVLLMTGVAIHVGHQNLTTVEAYAIRLLNLDIYWQQGHDGVVSSCFKNPLFLLKQYWINQKKALSGSNIIHLFLQV